MYQNLVIVGRVGNDPEMRYTPSGAPVATFSVAVNRKWTGADGTPQEKVTWYRVTCWRKLAETVSQYVTKGQQVLVEASDVEAKAYTASNGEARASLEVTASNVRFLGGRGDGESSAGVQNAPRAQETPADDEAIPW